MQQRRPQRPNNGLPLCTIFFFLVTVLSAAALALAAVSIHRVPEGHVGVYWFGGAIVDQITYPGFHFSIPFLYSYSFVQYTLQTDTVTSIPCGTSGGTVIMFDKIEVVNRLRKEKVLSTIKQYGPEYDKTWIFDKIHHEINQFCSSHTMQEVYISHFERLDEALANSLQKDCDSWETGIEVIAIRVTKPRIPEAVRLNYELAEQQKARLLVALQESLVTQKQEEIEQIKTKAKAEREAEVSLIEANRAAQIAMIEAEKQLNISRIEVEKKTAEKHGAQIIQQIENQIMLDRETAKSHALLETLTAEAEGLAKKLTPEFLQYTLYQSLANNTKIFFGDSIPDMFSPFLSRLSELEKP